MKDSAAASAARTHLEALAGAPAVAGALAQAGDELERWRTLAASGEGPAEVGPRVQLVLAPEGASARAPSGEALPALTAALRGAWPGIAFPDPSVRSVVVNATWRCASGRCAAVMEDAP